MQESSSPTRLCTITIIILRLLALKLGLDAVVYLLGSFALYHLHQSSFVNFIAAGVMVLCTCFLWLLSPFLARRITVDHDLSLDTGNLTLCDLYTFAFLLVGLYFALDSLGPSLTWFHYSVIQSSSTRTLSPEEKRNYYTLFQYLVKLILGLALVFNGRKFANKLIKHQKEAASKVVPKLDSLET